MEKIEEFLKTLGFSNNQIKVYLYVLNNNPATAAQIAKALNLPRTTVYDNLYKLETKNLVLENRYRNLKTFSLEPTLNLENIINNKKFKLKTQLNSLSKLKTQLPEVIETLKNKTSHEQKLIDIIKNNFYAGEFEVVNVELSKSPFEKLILELGLNFLEFICGELLVKFPNDERLKNLNLQLLKHQGKFTELKSLTKRPSLLDIGSQITYLEYLNIIGEAPNFEFINNLKRLVYSSTQDLERIFIPAYAEHIWLFSGVDKALSYTNSNLNKYKKFPEYTGKLTFLSGEFLRHKGEYIKALELYEKALIFLKSTCEKRYLALTYKSMSVCYRNLDLWEKSLEHVTEAVSISRNLEDKSLIARTVLSLGSFYEVRNNPSKALKYHQEALKLGKEMNSTRDEFYAGQNIGITELQLGHIENAYTIFRSTLKSARKLNRAYYLEMWIGFIISQKKGQFQKGIDLIMKSKKVAVDKNEQKRVDIANSLLGAAYFLSSLHKDKGVSILSSLLESTSSSIIKEGITELLSGTNFYKTKLCS